MSDTNNNYIGVQTFVIILILLPSIWEQIAYLRGCHTKSETHTTIVAAIQ